MSQHHQRVLKDIRELERSGFPVEIPTDSLSEISTIIPGPHGTPYAAGEFQVRIFIPPEYPFKSPSVGIIHCYHPNIDFASGSLCLDVLNASAWSPAFSLLNIVQQFIPQLLHYPNDADPLNVKAGRLRRNSIEEYETKARQMTKEWATGKESPLADAPPEVIKKVQRLRELDERRGGFVAEAGTARQGNENGVEGKQEGEGRGSLFGPVAESTLLLESPVVVTEKAIEEEEEEDVPAPPVHRRPSAHNGDSSVSNTPPPRQLHVPSTLKVESEEYLEDSNFGESSKGSNGSILDDASGILSTIEEDDFDLFDSI